MTAIPYNPYQRAKPGEDRCTATSGRGGPRCEYRVHRGDAHASHDGSVQWRDLHADVDPFDGLNDATMDRVIAIAEHTDPFGPVMPQLVTRPVARMVCTDQLCCYEYGHQGEHSYDPSRPQLLEDGDAER